MNTDNLQYLHQVSTFPSSYINEINQDGKEEARQTYCHQNIRRTPDTLVEWAVCRVEYIAYCNKQQGCKVKEQSLVMMLRYAHYAP